MRGVKHPAEETLRRFVLGTASPAENRAIVAHLLRRCSRCSRVLGKLLPEPEAVFSKRSKTKGITAHDEA
jgi:hypothetical protein